MSKIAAKLVELQLNDNLAAKTLEVDLGTLSRLEDPTVLAFIADTCNIAETESLLNINIISKAGLTALKNDVEKTMSFLQKIVKTGQSSLLLFI